MAFPDYPIVDDFDRPDEPPPMTGWADSLVGQGFSVVSNAAMQIVGGGVHSYVPSLGILGDSEARFTLTTPPTGDFNFVGLMLRFRLVPQEWYGMYVFGSGVVQIIKYGLGTIGNTSVTLNNDDEFGIQAIASTISVYYRPTGGGAWTNILSVVDTEYVGGYIGMVGADGSSAAVINDFGGGGIPGVVGPTAVSRRVLRLSNDIL